MARLCLMLAAPALLVLLVGLPPAAEAGHDNWIDLHIKNDGKDKLQVEVYLEKGHLYNGGDKWKTVKQTLQVIKKGDTGRVSATGSANSPTGAIGVIAIRRQRDHGWAEISRVRFECPFIGSNNFVIITTDKKTILNTPTWKTHGPLGEMKIVVRQAK